jgi:hypothetical protein
MLCHLGSDDTKSAVTAFHSAARLLPVILSPEIYAAKLPVLIAQHHRQFNSYILGDLGNLSIGRVITWVPRNQET